MRGSAAVAPLAVGAKEPINVSFLDFRPAPFTNLRSVTAPQHELTNYLWIGYYSSIYDDKASNLDRLALDGGASAGAGLFLQGVSSAPHFWCNDGAYVNQVGSLLGHAPSTDP